MINLRELMGPGRNRVPFVSVPFVSVNLSCLILLLTLLLKGQILLNEEVQSSDLCHISI